ncbi:YceI family protein [Paenibacillus thailandensis]|uniref:YceI family protein n=1 Tax=Paenibacillus thailandensis TaxID=393250 RepID=A0ABW5R0I2_9BACL
MRKKTAILTAGLAVLIVGGGVGYGLYDYYAGNHVQVESVIAAPAEGGTGEAVDMELINGVWNIDPSSTVYFSVTTSKETVNFAVNNVSGSWTIDTADPSRMAGEGKIDLNAIDSGNSQRDGHIKEADYFNVEETPEATFTATSFEGVPAEWTEGQPFPFKMSGTMTVKGISKEVTFEGNGVYEGGQIKLESDTAVTFSDFGMTNPHRVVLDTENTVTVQLRLTLTAQPA